MFVVEGALGGRLGGYLLPKADHLGTFVCPISSN